MENKIQNTRQKFNLLLGELIEAILGVDGVCKIFEAAENGDTQAQFMITSAGVSGQAPSGMIALKLGFVDKETKEALLTAQAAERALLVIEEIEKFYAVHVPELQKQIAAFEPEPDLTPDPFARHINSLMSPHEGLVKDYFSAHVKAADVNNKTFNFIGSPGDPKHLVCAQAMQQLVTEYERNEKMGMREQLVDQFMKIADYNPFGLDYLDAFKAGVAESYKVSAQILAEKGYEKIAQDMDAVSASIGYDVQKANEYSIENFAETFIATQHSITNTYNMFLDPAGIRDIPYAVMSEVWEQTIKMRKQQTLKCA